MLIDEKERIETQLTRERSLSTPSREAEGPPSFARNIGVIGACLTIFGYGIPFIRENYASIEFLRFVVRLCWFLGPAGLLYHAARDRDATIRRCYGLFAFALLLFGTIVTSLSVAIDWISPASSIETARIAGTAIAAALGLIVIIAAAVPFVRQEVSMTGERRPPSGWVGRFLAGLTTSSLVQKVVVFGAIVAASFVVLSHILVRNNTPGINFLLYGLISLGIGFLFLLPYVANEEEMAWRGAAVNVLGIIGAVAAAVGLSSVLTDWLNLEEILMPYGLVFGGVGLVFLWAFVVMQGSDTAIGYRTAIAFGLAGLAVLILTLVRSLVPNLAFPTATLQIPTAFLLTVLAGAYAAVGWGLAGDNRLLVMTRRELSAFFYSPIAYIVIAGIAAVAWVSFILFLSRINPETIENQGMPIPEPIVRFYLFALFSVICLIIAVPMVTMRLLSEEQRTGTIEVLLTAPVGEVSVVLSKFLAALIFFMLAWGSWAVFPIALRIIGQESFDYRPLMSFYVGLTCMSAGFLAMGLFCSSLTRNQIVAFLLGFVGMIILTIPVFFMWNAMDTGGAASETKLATIRYLSYLHHMDEWVEGKVRLHYLFFHVSLCIFWLFLTVKVLEARKWR